jgi:hypothetical protein
MLKTYQLNVDTGSLQTTGGGQGGSAQNFVTKVNGNPFQCQVLLGNRHRTVRTVSLKNAQIPVNWYNVRAPYNTITINGTLYTITPGVYTQASFITAFNAAIGGTLAIDGTTGIATITKTPANVTVPSGLTYPTLANLLGFTATQTLNGATSIAGTVPVTLFNQDTYVNIWIENMGASSGEPSQSTFKVPIALPVPQYNNVFYWAEQSQNEQLVCVTDSGARIDRLNIQVLDRYGQQLNNNGVDWALTLEIKSDN